MNINKVFNGDINNLERCSLCENWFYQSELKEHIAFHVANNIKEPEFKCQKCNKYFNYEYQYNIHVKTCANSELSAANETQKQTSNVTGDFFLEKNKNHFLNPHYDDF